MGDTPPRTLYRYETLGRTMAMGVCAQIGTSGLPESEQIVVRIVRLPHQPDGPGMPEVPMSASLLARLIVGSSKARIPVGAAAITPMAVAAITHAAIRVRECRVFMSGIRCWTRRRITTRRWTPRFGEDGWTAEVEGVPASSAAASAPDARGQDSTPAGAPERRLADPVIWARDLCANALATAAPSRQIWRGGELLGWA